MNIEDEDELETIYRPDYIGAYRDSQYDGPIEEWTQFEGCHLFSAPQIYKETSVNMAIQSNAHNAFSVNMTTPTWHSDLVQSVQSALVEADMCTAEDSVTLCDNLGGSIHNRPGAEMRMIGVIYPMVNGKRTCTPKDYLRGPGVAVKTPASHAVNKDDLLVQWGEDLAALVSDLVVENLVGSEDMDEITRKIGGTIHSDSVHPAIVKKTLDHAGHLDSFSHVLRIHSDPTVVKGIKDGDFTKEDVAKSVADVMLEEIVTAFRASSDDVGSFFKVRKSDLARATASRDGYQRTVFETAHDAEERVNDLRHKYPTDREMYRDIANGAFTDNPDLVNRVIFVLRNGPTNVHLRGGRRRRAARKPAVSVKQSREGPMPVDNHSHHYKGHTHHRGCGHGSGCECEHHGRHSVVHFSRYKGRLGGKRSREATRRAHRMSHGRPDAPGFLTIMPSKRADGGSTEPYDAKTWRGAYMSRQGPGRYPHANEQIRAALSDDLGDPPAMEPLNGVRATSSGREVDVTDDYYEDDEDMPPLMNLNVLQTSAVFADEKKPTTSASLHKPHGGPPPLEDMGPDLLPFSSSRRVNRGKPVAVKKNTTAPNTVAVASGGGGLPSLSSYHRKHNPRILKETDMQGDVEESFDGYPMLPKGYRGDYGDHLDVVKHYFYSRHAPYVGNHEGVKWVRVHGGWCKCKDGKCKCKLCKHRRRGHRVVLVVPRRVFGKAESKRVQAMVNPSDIAEEMSDCLSDKGARKTATGFEFQTVDGEKHSISSAEHKGSIYRTKINAVPVLLVFQKEKN